MLADYVFPFPVIPVGICFVYIYIAQICIRIGEERRNAVDHEGKHLVPLWQFRPASGFRRMFENGRLFVVLLHA